MKYYVNIDTNRFHRILILKQFNFTIVPIIWAFFSKFSVFIFDQSLNSLLPFKNGFFLKILCLDILVYLNRARLLLKLTNAYVPHGLCALVPHNNCLSTTSNMCLCNTQQLPWYHTDYVHKAQFLS